MPVYTYTSTHAHHARTHARRGGGAVRITTKIKSALRRSPDNGVRAAEAWLEGGAQGKKKRKKEKKEKKKKEKKRGAKHARARVQHARAGVQHAHAGVKHAAVVKHAQAGGVQHAHTGWGATRAARTHARTDGADGASDAPAMTTTRFSVACLSNLSRNSSSMRNSDRSGQHTTVFTSSLRRLYPSVGPSGAIVRLHRKSGSTRKLEDKKKKGGGDDDGVGAKRQPFVPPTEHAPSATGRCCSKLT
jgi:hypothetical protein